MIKKTSPCISSHCRYQAVSQDRSFGLKQRAKKLTMINFLYSQSSSFLNFLKNYKSPLPPPPQTANLKLPNPTLHKRKYAMYGTQWQFKVVNVSGSDIIFTDPCTQVCRSISHHGISPAGRRRV